jgi:DNA repair protein RecO (recombination protein O)
VTQVASDAIVLHAFDYRETSRILRIVTREHGVRSAIARGARRSKQRFGAALDLFAEGAAQIALHPTGDLHTLVSFDVVRARPELAARWDRFAAANALSELLLRFARDDTHTELYDAFRRALDAVGRAEGDEVIAAGLGGAWELVGHLGFAPVLDVCAACGVPVPHAKTAAFSNRTGGVVCDGCVAAGRLTATRKLPGPPRDTIAAWVAGESTAAPGIPELRAHLRLLREFLVEHLADDRALRAFAVWERDSAQRSAPSVQGVGPSFG